MQKTLFDGMLPSGAIVVEAEPFMWESGLLSEESLHVERSVLKRKREFTAGRNCLRRALMLLGHPEVAIGVGSSREPLLPSGFAGSITHTDKYCAAAILREKVGVSIGIDAEPMESLDQEVIDLILRPLEKRHANDLQLYYPGFPWARMMFSAKESFHKALFRVWPVMLDFLDAELQIEPTSGRFDLKLPDFWQEPVGNKRYSGCFRFGRDLIVTTAVVPLKVTTAKTLRSS
jgi:4'-phosphopantetheinyl transferase EntD